MTAKPNRLVLAVIAAAIDDLGQPEEINRVFTDFQQYLYPPQMAV